MNRCWDKSMKLSHSVLSLALLTLVSACAAPFAADVARFQRMPAPSGESFVIEAKDKARAGSLEFAQYASYVEGRMTQQGYQRASSPDSATLIVKLDYGVNDGREKVQTRYSGYGGYGYGYGWPYYGGYYRHRPYYWGGYYDPFWGSSFGAPEVYSYTVYRSYLDLDIVRKASGEPVFEGRAEATTRSPDLTRLVPNLVEAMFTGFPGNSGQTVRIKLEPKKGG